MKPKFATIAAWQQAEQLMQPAFIRLVDNLRKQLEVSDWQGSYREFLIWADDIPPETQEAVLQLQSQRQGASAEQLAEIEAELAHLPSPHPGYELCLERRHSTAPEITPDPISEPISELTSEPISESIVVDLWQICYQICFQTTEAELQAGAAIVIDTSLFEDGGEIDWHRLDHKTRTIVQAIFDQLPA